MNWQNDKELIVQPFLDAYTGNNPKARKLGVVYELKQETWKGDCSFGDSYRIVTGDGKWIRYDNPKRKKSWGKPDQPSTSTPKPEPKPNIHGSKLMLCIW